MANSNAPVDVPAALAADPAPAPVYIDFGQPVEHPPPMTELIGFDELPPTVRREPDAVPADPPRRRFLPPPAPAAAGFPALIEPTAEPETPIRTLSRRAGLLRSRMPRLVEFTVPALKPLNRLSLRWRIVAGCAAAAVVVLVAVALLARGGPPAPGQISALAPAPPPGNPADRLALYQKGADAGDAEAQLQLAILYARGDGVAQDFRVAAKWFRTAADQGLPRAQYDVGVLYERGRGVAVDLDEATKWYLKAAEAKYPLAQYNLAVCYTKGQGIRKDLSEAAVWYRRAGLQGVVQAMVNLGTMYDRGEGVPASPVDAYAWYLASGRRGSDIGTKRSAELFAAMPKLDQIRAEALASDVAASIHDPKPDKSGPAVGGTVQPGTDAAARH